MLKFFDTYDNPAMPTDDFQLGMALLQSGQNAKDAYKDAQSYEFEIACVDRAACIYEVT